MSDAEGRKKRVEQAVIQFTSEGRALFGAAAKVLGTSSSSLMRQALQAAEPVLLKAVAEKTGSETPLFPHLIPDSEVAEEYGKLLQDIASGTTLELSPIHLFEPKAKALWLLLSVLYSRTGVNQLSALHPGPDTNQDAEDRRRILGSWSRFAQALEEADLQNCVQRVREQQAKREE